MQYRQIGFKLKENVLNRLFTPHSNAAWLQVNWRCMVFPTVRVLFFLLHNRLQYFIRDYRLARVLNNIDHIGKVV